MNVADPYDLARFRTAQQPVFETALAELRFGCKKTHWMWFVFPQLRGLGRSPTAEFYGISSIQEARAYLADAILGSHLRIAVEATLAVEDSSAHAIFGSPDDMKFRSSMTLFEIAAGAEASTLFRQALDRYFHGERDVRSLQLLSE